MSQNIATRHEVRGVITCRSAVHVGGWSPSVAADLAVARDGLGLPFVPGTSIAGALRGYLHGMTGFRDHLDDLFGHIKEDGSPSWVRVDDAHLVAADGALAAAGGGGTEPVVRDGVGIDRRTGSAAAGILYGREVLPAGTRFAFRLVADTPAKGPGTGYAGGWDALVADATAAVVDGLRSGRVPLGAARTRGLGRVTLDDTETRAVDLSRREGLVGWLRGGSRRTPAAPAEAAPAALGDGLLAITIAWRPVSPVLVKDSLEGTVVDALPLTEVNADGTVRLLLPGSSVKGVLRAHAERIVRTLRRQDVPAGFADGLADPPSGVDVLFGVAPKRREGNARQPAEAGWRGALAVADCYSERSVEAKRWNDVLAAHPGPTTERGEKREKRAEDNKHREDGRSALRNELEKMNSSFALGVSDHVAIDRWTGGAADHRLFSVLDPAAETPWEPIRLTLDVGRLTRASTRRDSSVLALPLLLLVLRDLTDGWLSLGYGGTRGRGQIKVSEIGFTGAGLGVGWQALAGSTLQHWPLADPPPGVVAAMDAWAKEFTDQEVPV